MNADLSQDSNQEISAWLEYYLSNDSLAASSFNRPRSRGIHRENIRRRRKGLCDVRNMLSSASVHTIAFFSGSPFEAVQFDRHSGGCELIYVIHSLLLETAMSREA